MVLDEAFAAPRPSDHSFYHHSSVPSNYAEWLWPLCTSSEHFPSVCPGYAMLRTGVCLLLVASTLSLIFEFWKNIEPRYGFGRRS